MRVRAVVVDFDGTIAGDQQPLTNPELISQFRKLKARGVKIVLNTGRDLGYVLGPRGLLTQEHVKLFDAIIVEGGGAVWYPGDRAPRVLTRLHSPEVVHEMRRLKIPSEVIWTGHTAIMTRKGYAPKARKAIDNVNKRRIQDGRHPVMLEEITNNNSVTYLPPGIHKGYALLRVVTDGMGVAPSECLGAGDGPNDLAFLALCGAAVVPSNGNPRNKQLPNAILTKGADAEGLVEVLRVVLRNGLMLDPPASPGCQVA